MSTLKNLTIILLALAFAACSGSKGGAEKSMMRKSLGTTTMNNIVQYSELTLLTNYSYRYEREETTSPDNIYLMTEWKDAPALEDEQALGIQFARSRITITARTSNRTTGDVRARFTAETQYRKTGAAEWVDAPMTEQREAYYEDIIDYLERQLRSAWRQ